MAYIFCRLLYLIILGPVLTLCGCAGGSYSSAALTAPVLSTEEIALRYSLNTSWWTGYGSPALNRTVELALERNIDLARSAITVNKALYRSRQISSDLLPSFSADASASSTRNLKGGQVKQAGQSGQTDKTWEQSWQGETSVSYELDLWRRLRNAADAGEWEHRATAEDLASVRLALINSVVDAWFYLLYTDQAITITQKNVEHYKRIASLAQSRYSLGKATVVEPLQAEQSLLAAQNTLSNQQIQRAEALQTLRDLLDMRPGEMPDTDQADILAVPSVQVDLNVPVAALAARPDIRAAEARLQKAFNTLQADQAAWYPRLTVGSTISLSADNASRFFNVPLLSGIVNLNLPFLDWNTLHWNSKISEADFESTKLDLVKSVTTALNEVDAGCSAYVYARKTLGQTLTEHDRAMRIAQYYRVRYEQGGAELKDYLEALTTADSSELSALSAKHSLVRLESRIYKAMGGRYEPLQQ